MLSWLLTRWHERRQRRAVAALHSVAAGRAVASASEAFAAAYPQRDLTSGHGRVETVADGHVVTLTYALTRPPMRSFWHVDGADRARELSHEEAATHIHIPVWR